MNEEQVKESEVLTISERELQTHVSSYPSFYHALLPAIVLLSVVCMGTGHLFALVGDEQVWLQEDDGRVPKGGEGANSLP